MPFLPRFTLKEIDRGWKAIRKGMKNAQAKGDHVKVGVIGDSKKARRKGEQISNVDLAIIHEYGATEAGIPERSFVRSTFEANKAQYIALLRQLIPKIYEQKIEAEKVLGLVGAQMAADMKTRIREGIPPPLSQATVNARLSRMRHNAMANALDASKGWDGLKAYKRVKDREAQAAMASAVFGDSAGGAKPLVDTGQLINSITWAVVKGKK